VHLTKKKKKLSRWQNTQSDPPDLFKTKRKKKYAAACPTRLPSGYKLPKLDFLEVGVFLEAISKYYSVPFFVN